jgi:hypothetical protein
MSDRARSFAQSRQRAAIAREQSSLFHVPHAPITPRAPRAARVVAHQATQGIGHKAPTQLQRIYGAIVAARHEGMTRRELSRALGIEINAVCGRVGELLKRGWIVEPGTLGPDGPRRMRDGGAVLVGRDYAQEAA